MASKICTSCGAKNPSSAYICTNCAASLLDVDSAPYRSQTPVSWSTQKTDTASVQPTPVAEETRTSTGPPIAVVEQSQLGSVLNALGNVIYLLIFGLGAGIVFGGEILSVVIIVVVVVVPIVLGYLFRPKYEFYASRLVRVSRSGHKYIDYSQISSVNKARSRIIITLGVAESDFRRGRIVIPGDPKLPDGMDLSTWLKSKIPQVQTKERDESETTEAGS